MRPLAPGFSQWGQIEFAFYTGSYIFLVLGIFCLFAYFSQRDLNRLMALRQRGVIGQAAVTDLYRNVGGGKRAFGIYYQFTAGNRSYRGFRSVSEHYLTGVKVGTPLQVTYLPEDPANHYAGRMDDRLLQSR